MRRGFKSEAERIALKVRRDLGLGTADPLDPWRLAQHQEFVVLTTRELGCLPHEAEKHEEAVSHFEEDASGDFSALTAEIAGVKAIVLNSGHSRARQANSLAHELSHALLRHPPRPAFGPGGCRNCNPQEEEEADWLGPVLLVPRDAALGLVRENVPIESAAQRYGTSVELMRMRINTSGARVQVQRSRFRR
jgi:Zn-dependent peptidase ImmA (M78 family)